MAYIMTAYNFNADMLALVAAPDPATMRAYIDATAGLTDGTLVSIDGSDTVPIPPAKLSIAVPVGLRCSAGFQSNDSTVIAAPSTAFEVSADGTTWGATAAVGVVQDVNTRVWFRQVTRVANEAAAGGMTWGYDGVLSEIDRTASAQVTGLAATNGDTESVLTWDAATDNVGGTGYKVYKDGTLLDTLGDVLTYTATGLTNDTTYSFTVSALDAAGNEGAESDAAEATPVRWNFAVSQDWSMSSLSSDIQAAFANGVVYYNVAYNHNADVAEMILAVLNGNTHALPVVLRFTTLGGSSVVWTSAGAYSDLAQITRTQVDGVWIGYIGINRNAEADAVWAATL